MKRWVILLLLFPALVLSATGKQEAAQPAKPAVSAAAAEWGNINWQQFAGTKLGVIAAATTMGRNYDKFIQQFEALTGIKVRYELLGDVDRKKKQIVDFAAGTAEYDVGFVGFQQREEYAQAGYLEGLDKYLKDAKLTDSAWFNYADIPPDLRDAGRTKAGELVFIPFTAEYFLLWNRKDVFSTVGVTVPKDFAELRATAEKLNNARVAGTVKEYAWADRAQPGSGEAGWSLFCMASRYGVKIVDFDTMTSYVNTSKGKEVIRYYSSMLMDFAPPGSGNWTWTDIAKAYQAGTFVMTTGANGAYVILENPAVSTVVGKVGYSPPPMNPGGKDPLFCWGWGINADSKNKGAAWLFVQWATSPTLMRVIVPKFYGCPARASRYSELDYIAGLPAADIASAQNFMLKNVDPRPQLIHAKYAEASDIISKELSNILAGVKTLDQACADADRELAKMGINPAK
jgi:multiple sugar transport system substrate-binding protein